MIAFSNSSLLIKEKLPAISGESGIAVEMLVAERKNANV